MRLGIIFLMIILSAFTCPAQPAARQYSISIIFHDKVGNNDLQTDSSYLNADGEIFTIHAFKYYISHIIFKDSITRRSQSVDGKCFLVDEDDSLSRTISLQTFLAHITSLQFMIGVDSLTNTTGVQTGSLDPANGMFWTWNTGYIMAKLEGESPAAKTPGRRFSYHVGGYKNGENAARTIQIRVPLSNGQGITSIYINADAGKWFFGVRKIKIADSPFCHEPGVLAMRLADNYATMFSLAAVK